MKHPRTYTFFVSVLIFGLQALFVRAFHLFFTQLDVQALIPWSFLGILLSCLLLSLDHLRFGKYVISFLNLKFVCVTLIVYALSCLYIIHFIPALIMVVVVNTALGMCLARAVMSLEAYRFYLLDFMGGIAGCVAAFFLPVLFSLEATFLFFIFLAAFIGTCVEVSSSFKVWRLVSSLLLITTLYLGAHPFVDLTQYGSLYQKPQDYTSSPFLHGQLMLQLGKEQRITSDWSSVGKVEVHESSSSEGVDLNFYINNINHFTLTPTQPKVPGDFGKGKRALVLGSGGGWEMRFLRDQGFRDITGVEINEILFDLVTKRFAEPAGFILNESKSILGEARNFIEMDRSLYDLIIVRYLGASGGLIGSTDDLSENYLFTQEAFKSYYDRLAPNGILMTGTSYSKEPSPNPGLLRIVESLSLTLRTYDQAPAEQMWIVGQERAKDTIPEKRFRALVFARKGEASKEIFKKEEQFIQDMQRGLGIENFYIISRPEGFDVEKSLVSSHLNSQEVYAQKSLRQDMVQDIRYTYDLDISPVTDDRPYFYHFEASPAFPLKNSRILFWLSLFLVFVLWGYLWRLPYRRKGKDFYLLSMAGALGFAYGILQISLLNAFTIAFSSVTWNFLLLVCGLLGGSVLAGAFGDKLTNFQRKVFILLAAVGLMSLFVFDFKNYILLFESQYERSFFLILVTLFISFGASLSYPLILKSSEGAEPRMPAFILGINSGFFIIGTVVCRYMALTLSLRHVFLLAGLIYFCVAFLIPKGNGPRSA